MRRRYRIKPNHPAMKKLEQVFALMDELKIELSASNGNVSEATVRIDGKEYELVDIEESLGNQIRSFPPTTEYKLVFEKEESSAEEPQQSRTQKGDRPEKQDKNSPNNL